MMNQAFISLGSNIEPEENLPRAIQHLVGIGKIISVSMVYQNPAIGPTPQADFLNAAVLIETDLDPLGIRTCLREIEAEMGRVRSEDKYAPRTIDLDLCLLGDTILESEDIVLPDPDLLERPHLSVPIAELDPDFPHPITGQSLGTIAARIRNDAALTPRVDVARRMTFR